MAAARANIAANGSRIYPNTIATVGVDHIPSPVFSAGLS
jgi:hypothetical protein